MNNLEARFEKDTCFKTSYTADLVCFSFIQFSDRDIDALYKLSKISSEISELKNGLMIWIGKGTPVKEDWVDMSDDFFELIVCAHKNNVSFLRLQD